MTRITSGNLDVERTQLENLFPSMAMAQRCQPKSMVTQNDKPFLGPYRSDLSHSQIVSSFSEKYGVYYVYILCINICIYIYISHLFNVSYGCLGMIPFRFTYPGKSDESSILVSLFASDP